MGIFKRTKRTPPAAGERRFTKRERERIDALWRLTALPRAEFDATYGVLLERCWRCIGGPDGEDWTALRNDALACAVAALKARQAHVLPRFGAAEDAARLAEVMSFALAAAVIAERLGLVLGRASAPGWSPTTEDAPAAAVLEDVPVPRAYGALLLPRLAGDAGLSWLSQEPEALRALAAYFGAGPSELRSIAVEAAERVGLPIGVAPGAPDPSPTPALDESTDGNDPEAAPVGKAPAAEPEAGEGQATQTPVLIGGVGAGWRWINWVRAGLREGSIVANADGGWLHNLGGDAFVVRPTCFEAYAAVEGVAPGTVKNRVAKLRRHRLRKWERGVANTFRAELKDGRRVDGMLFPGELIWDDDPPPEAGAKLR